MRCYTKEKEIYQKDPLYNRKKRRELLRVFNKFPKEARAKIIKNTIKDLEKEGNKND